MSGSEADANEAAVQLTCNDRLCLALGLDLHHVEPAPGGGGGVREQARVGKHGDGLLNGTH